MIIRLHREVTYIFQYIEQTGVKVDRIFIFINEFNKLCKTLIEADSFAQFTKNYWFILFNIIRLLDETEQNIVIYHRSPNKRLHMLSS